MRGYFAVGVEHSKNESNIGTLFRSATTFGAAFLFTIGKRYRRQCSDTTAADRHIPVFHFATISELLDHLPLGCPLVGVELDDGAVPLHRFAHPERACYLLGAEDHGLTTATLALCHSLVEIPAKPCLNVSVAGSIVMYDRMVKCNV